MSTIYMANYLREFVNSVFNKLLQEFTISYKSIEYYIIIILYNILSSSR